MPCVGLTSITITVSGGSSLIRYNGGYHSAFQWFVAWWRRQTTWFRLSILWHYQQHELTALCKIDFFALRFEYFCQMSSKLISIHVISSYTVLSWCIFWDTVYVSIMYWFQDINSTQSKSSQTIRFVRADASFLVSLSLSACADWLIEHGFTSAPTQYRLYGRRFLQVSWPNQQCQSTEGGWLVIQTGLNLTVLTSPCYNTSTCMQILHKKII